LDSILEQTYTNFEIILIDDGSTDASGRICDDYAQKDARITVIHKENKGQSDARNVGMQMIKGDIVTFIDSDDYVTSNILEHLLENMLKYDADISICKLLPVYENLPINTTLNEKNIVILSGLEAMEDAFTSNTYVLDALCCKMYKTWLFKETEISFPIGRVHEDTATIYKLCHHAKRVVHSSAMLYYYLQRSGSTMDRGKFSVLRLDAVTAAKEAVEYVKTHNLPLLEQSYYHYLKINLIIILLIVNGSEWREKMDTLNLLRNNTIDFIPQPTKNRFSSTGMRLNLILIRFGYWLYIPVRKIWNYILRR